MPAQVQEPRAFLPRRIVIGANAHAAIEEALRQARPDLEWRGRKYSDISVEDLTWGDTYVGFRRPSPESMGNVRWVHSTGAGVDPWFFPTELPRTILLTRSSESFGPMIAEWALSRALAFSQQIVDLARCQQQSAWAPRDVSLLKGSTAVIVGTGDVGANVGRLFAAVGCNVVGVSRTGRGDATVFQRVVPVASLFDEVGTAEWLVVTVPLTTATRGLISAPVLGACRGAVLINSGRGAVVDEAAIPQALDAGWLRGAALDVFAVEPLPVNSPLWRDDRVMISPHISGLTTIAGAVQGFVECLDSLERNAWPQWMVDRERQY